VAFAKGASHAQQEWKYGLDPILHVPFHHSDDLRDVIPPGIQVRRVRTSRLTAQDGDENYNARARLVAHHSLCMRAKHWPAYNSIEPSTLFRRLLPNDADRRCDDAELALPPQTIFSHDQNFTRYDTKLAEAKVQAIRASVADPRPLCFEPLPAGTALGQSWWTPDTRSRL